MKLPSLFAAGVLLMAWGLFQLMARSVGWKRLKHSTTTVIFLSEKDWDRPLAKTLDLIGALFPYSIGLWILLTKAF
jgi:hypothetical protein